MRLKDKVCLVTGAAGAIGAATAREMAAQGARLVLVDRDAAALQAVMTDVDPAVCLLVDADVTRESENARMVGLAVQRFGPLDVFFANAGIEGQSAPLLAYDEAVYDAVMAVNVDGVFFGLRQVLPHLRDGGSIIITSSIAGVAGAARNAAYSASKHAVVGLMRSVANEAAPRRIRVNTVNPGIVDSPMIRRLLSQHPDPAAGEAQFLARIKLGRMVSPADVAHAVIFLASDDSRMITSQTLVVDGGMLG
jgi:NAD(P)-dependent dehydrogenase (short-subunit alcohol dehydrogenase family)